MDFAYIIDGGPLRWAPVRNLSAVGAELTFQGRNVHPGTVEDQMVNALQLLLTPQPALGGRPTREDRWLPRLTTWWTWPVQSKKHAITLPATLRQRLFKNHRKLLGAIADKMNQELGSALFLTLKDQYYNMKQVIEKDMTPIHIAKAAAESLDIQFVSSSLSVAELTKFPLWASQHLTSFAGGENMHGRFEYAQPRKPWNALSIPSSALFPIKIVKETTKFKRNFCVFLWFYYLTIIICRE